MAINISVYTDPGVYISEVIEPGSISISSERVMAIVGIAPRTRFVSQEAVIRGKIYEESLAVALATPHTAQLINVSDRSKTNSVLYMNDNPLGIGDWDFLNAELVGNTVAGGTVDTTIKKKFTISLDYKKVITITLTSGAATPLTIIASDINSALNADPDYGISYANVATVNTNILKLTSPTSGTNSDIKVFLSYEDIAVTYEDAASDISNGAWIPTETIGVRSPTIISISDNVYISTATYKIEYVAVDVLLDKLVKATVSTPLDNIVSIGSYPGAISYNKNTDYKATGNNVDWDTTYWTQSILISSVTGPYIVVAGTNDKLLFSINNNDQILVTIAAATYTAAQLAELLNIALNNSSDYGPHYSHSFSDDGTGKLKFIAPSMFDDFPDEVGYSSMIQFMDVANNAFDTIYGSGISLPYEIRGFGIRPDFGTVFYINYNYTRATVDYNEPVRVYTPEQLYDFTSPLTLDNYSRNKLAIAGEIAFENVAPSIYIVQIDDSTTPGIPTQNQINTAIDACSKKKYITEVVVLDTSVSTAVRTMEHVSLMTSFLEKKYRRAWYGMARGTEIGDPDTLDTFLYRSTRTLQPGSSSPGRGRQILVAPAKASRTLTLSDGTEVDINCDGSYIAVAVAALFTSLPSPSNSLINKTIRGFNIDDFETYLKGERHTLVDKGVCVVTLDAGKLMLLDPVTTEAGGGKVVQFEEPQSSAAKDSVTNTVDSLLFNNCVGIVPDDVADFITDIKSWIVLGIEAEINSGSIGPFRGSNNVVRKIDPKTDIQVFLSTTDPRTYYFRYWFNLKYPAKRFFGEYSVDNPFFSPEG